MRNKQLTGSSLKIIGLTAMLLDHIGAMYILNDSLSLKGIPIALCIIGIMFRVIGRLAFPIFCFLLIEGYIHTSNKIKYACRLLIFALLSEIPYDLYFFSTYIHINNQNIFFTLLLGVFSVSCIDYFSRFENNKILYQTSSVLLFSVLAESLHSDYGFFGVLFISCLYVCRENIKLQIIISSIPLFFCGIGEILGVLAFIPISKYNGERGLRLKYIFYAFYPIHLILLYCIKTNFNIIFI